MDKFGRKFNKRSQNKNIFACFFRPNDCNISYKFGRNYCACIFDALFKSSCDISVTQLSQTFVCFMFYRYKNSINEMCNFVLYFSLLWMRSRTIKCLQNALKPWYSTIHPKFKSFRTMLSKHITICLPLDRGNTLCHIVVIVYFTY